MSLILIVSLSVILGRLARADTFQVTKVEDTRDESCGSDCSLREAIIAANQHPGPDTVIVPAGAFLLLLGQLDILDDLSLLGEGADNTRIDGNRISRVFEVRGATIVQMNGVTVQHGTSSSGGGVFNSGTLTLHECTLSGNSGGNGGGGIYNVGTLTLQHCRLSGNSGSFGGGGLYNTGTAMLSDSTLSGNFASVQGGGGIFNDGELRVADSTLSENSTNWYGGGIYSKGTTTLAHSILTGNSAHHGGGAIAIFGAAGHLWAEDCELFSNTSSEGGGIGIYNLGSATLKESTLSGNSAHANGGAVWNSATLAVEDCALNGNRAGQGGGIFNNGAATLTNSTVSGNSADNGAGVANSGSRAKLTIENCTLSSNRAVRDGGGIYHSGRSTVMLANSALSGNLAGNGGGIGIFYGSAATLTNCTLSGNAALYGPADSGNGGAIYSGGTASLTNCTLAGNTASNGGGIFGTAVLRNTIVANTSQGRNCAAIVGSDGHNMDDDRSCGLATAGDLSGVAAHLAPFGDHGGATRTYALCTAPGTPHADCDQPSPAIDAGDDTRCPATDQRHALRPVGSACDIGAYESGAPLAFTATVVATETPTPTSTAILAMTPDTPTAPSALTPSTPTVTPTQPSTLTATLTPTSRSTGTSTPNPSPTTTTILIACVGDCSSTGAVTINDLINGVNMSLGVVGLDHCPAFDRNDDERVTVDELIAAVQNALAGCRRS